MDGKCILAGGNSKYICLYEIEHKVLLRKFQVSENRSLDGVLNYLSSREVTDAGLLNEIDNDDVKGPRPDTLPGKLSSSALSLYITQL